ncbi:hypothetical protein FJNA_08360 [Thermus sp. FJN-A]
MEFTPLEAAHLLRRAAARGRKEEAEALADLGLKGAVERLLAPPVLPPDPALPEKPGEAWEPLTAWWLNHWLATPTPAVERLVLFLHGHFTSELMKVRSPQAMALQNQTFRALAYGSFRDLLFAVARNPAMLLYLDNAQSRKEHPNENWARELLELFTLGVGQYGEEDVMAAARAFTGYSVDEKALKEGKPRFLFRPAWHDPGKKRFLGREVESGEDVLEILADHPATYRRLARKLLAFYLSPDPEPDLEAEVARILKGMGFREALAYLFQQEAFYRARGRLVKAPVEYVVGLAYAASLREVPRAWIRALPAMGQAPFNPPSVKGWEGGRAWLGDTALLVRLNLAAGLKGPVDLFVFAEGEGLEALVRPEAQLL